MRYPGWKEVRNGGLLKLAAAEYDVFITNDASIPYQQHIRDLGLCVIVLGAPSNKLEDIRPLLPRVLRLVWAVKPGKVRFVQDEPELPGL